MHLMGHLRFRKDLIAHSTDTPMVLPVISPTVGYCMSKRRDNHIRYNVFTLVVGEEIGATVASVVFHISRSGAGGIFGGNPRQIMRMIFLRSNNVATFLANHSCIGCTSRAGYMVLRITMRAAIG